MCVNSPENTVKEPFDSGGVEVHVFMVLYIIYRDIIYSEDSRSIETGPTCGLTTL